MNGSRPGPLMVAISVLEGDRLRAPRSCQTTRSVLQINSLRVHGFAKRSGALLYLEYQSIIHWLVNPCLPVCLFLTRASSLADLREPITMKSTIFFHLDAATRENATLMASDGIKFQTCGTRWKNLESLLQLSNSFVNFDRSYEYQ